MVQSFITIFAFEESLERFALQFGELDTRFPRNAFLKSEWQMTNDAVILYQNAMKIEMPTEVHFHKRQVSLFKIFQHVFRTFCFMLLKSKVFKDVKPPNLRYNVALVEFSFSILCVSFVTIILFKERFVKKRTCHHF